MISCFIDDNCHYFVVFLLSLQLHLCWCASLSRSSNDNYSRVYYVKHEKCVMERALTQRLIMLDINTIKRTTQIVIKEKPNKILRTGQSEIEKHMAVDRAIQQLNSTTDSRTQNTSFNLHLHFYYSCAREYQWNERSRIFPNVFFLSFLSLDSIYD